jgi:hypothetical protein
MAFKCRTLKVKVLVHQSKQAKTTFYFPSNAHNVKNVELLKHFKIRKEISLKLKQISL